MLVRPTPGGDFASSGGVSCNVPLRPSCPHLNSITSNFGTIVGGILTSGLSGTRTVSCEIPVGLQNYLQVAPLLPAASLSVDTEI